MADLSITVTNLETLLNSSTPANLVEWTESELYEYFDEAAKRLTRRFNVFVERDTTTTIELGTPSYSVPAGHVATIHVSVGVTDPIPDFVALYPSTVGELEALDADWVDSTGTSDTWLHDLGTQTTRLYASPDETVSGQSLAVIFNGYPETITVESAVIESMPPVLQCYFLWHGLAEARRRESDMAMPEVAAHFDERMKLVEKVIEQYWGASQ